MKILVHADKFYPDMGGVESRVRRISQYLHQAGETVTVITRTPREGDAPLPFRVVRRPSRRTLRALIHDSDLVYMNGFDASLFLWSKIMRKKVVMTYFDLTPICPKGTKMKWNGPCLENASLRACLPCLKKSGEFKIVRRLLRPPLKYAISLFIDRNVCISGFGYRRYPLFKKHLIENGIDTGLFIPDADKQGGLPPAVLFVGRLVPEKGCQVLIEALSLCTASGVPFRLTICGEGPYRSTLEEMIDRHHLRESVKFFGPAGETELIQQMQQADIVVVPSLWDEVFGNVTIEAMSCGCAVVASDVGGLGDIARKCGLVFERGDSRGLAAALKTLLKDEKLRIQVGKKCRQLAVEEYDWNTMGNKYHTLFRSLAPSSANK
jgi:glycosyltransferase involved in cell wall biosynthesis